MIQIDQFSVGNPLNQIFAETSASGTLQMSSSTSFFWGGSHEVDISGGRKMTVYDYGLIFSGTDFEFDNGYLVGGKITSIEAQGYTSPVITGNITVKLTNPGLTFYEVMALVHGAEARFTSAFNSHGWNYTGTDDADNITSSSVADILHLGAGNDTVHAGDGNDTIYGDAGNDIMYGGKGDDTYYVDTNNDSAREAVDEGYDRVFASASFFLLSGSEIELLAAADANATTSLYLRGNELAQTIIGNAGANNLLGLAGNDVLNGKGGADTLNGGDGIDTASYAGAKKGVTASLLNASINTNDAAGDTYSSIERLEGSSYADILYGNNASNRVSGGSGDDKIYGGLGSDTLVGGAGKDVFVFDTKLGTTNVDTITDFYAPYDQIQLDDDIFTTAGAVGKLSSGAFYAGTAAHDSTDRIIYDKATGKLWYDEDGNGAHAAIQFATISNKVTLSYSDFDLIA